MMYSNYINDSNKIWLVDLDNTLYYPRSKIMERIDQRIETYISYKCKCSLNKARKIRKKVFKKYKNTFIGVLKEGIINEDELVDFLEFAHKIDIDDRLEVNYQLVSILKKVKGKKYIFSNAVKSHILRILKKLNLESYFDGYYGLGDFNFHFKPEEVTFFKVIEDLKVHNTNYLCLVDDTVENLETAERLGISTINTADFIN